FCCLDSSPWCNCCCFSMFEKGGIWKFKQKNSSNCAKKSNYPITSMAFLGFLSRKYKYERK
ncbi:MAG TPA: hypothetical protein PLP05_12410, partial [Sedimentisphaerales bacterium]|nr:hypothetical protein [Sedimentisphaerales bacterium]